MFVVRAGRGANIDSFRPTGVGGALACFADSSQFFFVVVAWPWKGALGVWMAKFRMAIVTRPTSFRVSACL